MALRTRPGPNISIPSGDVFPSGMIVAPSPPGIQSSVRPAGSLFQKSPGYESVRPGQTRFQGGYRGLGIHFVPLHFAEDLSTEGPEGVPPMVDAERARLHADVAELPGSAELDAAGNVPHLDAEAGHGVKFQRDKTFPTGGEEMHPETRRSYTGDGSRSPAPDKLLDRNVSDERAYAGRLFKNPATAFRGELAQSPAVAIGVAALIVSGLYVVGRDLDRALSRRRPSGAGAGAAVGTVAAAPPAAVETAGTEAAKAGKAANETISAAGDAVQEVAEKVEEVAEAAADAVSEKKD